MDKAADDGAFVDLEKYYNKSTLMQKAVAKPLADGRRQSARLKYLWENGLIDQPVMARSRFANLHRCRVC